MILVSASTAINAWMMQPVLDDIFIKMSKLHNPYGDGTASEKITNIFQKSLI